MKTFFAKAVPAIFLMIIMTLLVSSTITPLEESCTVAFNVKKQGSGKPMIFIPGLYCSGEVWDDAVAHFSGRYECHTLTLPGFGGQAAIRSDSILATVAHQIACYIRENKLQKPVIVGHSLGGWLALKLGVLYPGLVGDLVVVSAAPFLPALSMGQAITADSAGKIGRYIQKQLASQTPEQIRMSQRYILATMMKDTARITQVGAMAVQSDPATQGQVMYELYSNDLRPVLQNIRSRVLVLGDWSAYQQFGASHQSVYDNLKGQFKQANKVTIELSDSARHFIMFDEPQWFYSQTDRCLQ
jgi:N-formylmaleamate deformylase